MPIKSIHTADIHLGKTYKNSPGESERYEDFFASFTEIITAGIKEEVDFILVVGDLFHTGQILPKTFAKTIEALQPLKDSGIPCIAVEGNHDWIHRRDNISWMEALSEMGYIRLLRPARTDEGGYRFDPFNDDTGAGGHTEIKGLNIYGLGYIGAQAGNHIERICEAIITEKNLLLFHVGVWTYSPVEIGNMTLEEAHPLADTFDYVALGHGHKPYIINTPDGRPYAYNPGSPERVNFGEEKYEKGYYLVTVEEGDYSTEVRPTTPRPMFVEAIDLDGAESADEAFERFTKQMQKLASKIGDTKNPLLELKLIGRIKFHPFELSRERLKVALADIVNPLHVEIKNHLSLVYRRADGDEQKKSLAEIERDVLGELIAAHSDYKEREVELVELALSIRDLVVKGDAEGEDLLKLLSRDV